MDFTFMLLNRQDATECVQASFRKPNAARMGETEAVG
jgi:hypothetical protein